MTPATIGKEDEKIVSPEVSPAEPKKLTHKDLLELARIAPKIKGFLLELGRSGKDVKEQLKDLHDKINNELLPEANEEEKTKLQDIKGRVEKLLSGIENKEYRIEGESVKRVKRELGFAENVEKMKRGEDVPEAARRELSGYLDRKSWGNIISNLKEGDRVLTLLVPGADFLSVKNLNDKIFGPQKTDEILEKKRLLVEKKMSELGIKLIQHDYKTEILRIDSGSNISTSELEKIMAEIDSEMSGIIEDMAKEKYAEEKDEKKKKILEEFINNLSGKKGGKGFRMTYGISTVEGNTTKEKLLSVTRSQQKCRLARENKDVYGGEFQESEILTELDKIKSLRKELISKYENKIRDKDGNEFVLFVSLGGKLSLNRDVLRDVRKEKFLAEDEEQLKKVVLYVKKLNLLDIVKPFTQAEVINGQLDEELQKSKQLSEGIKNNNLSESDRMRAAEELSVDEKDEHFTSRNKFHSEAVKISNAKYESIDALDIGVDQILECESILMQLEKIKDSEEKMEKLKELSVIAGDETTERLREFRDIVFEVYKEKLGLDDSETVLGVVGGDELTLAFDMDKVSQEQIDEIMFEIRTRLKQGKKKKGTEIRIIQTVMSEAGKEIDQDADPDTRIEAHLEALKRAEVGTTIAKEIEESLRKLNRILNKKGTVATEENINDIGLDSFFVIEKGKVSSDFLVIEVEEAFFLKTKTKLFNLAEVKDALSKYRDSLEKTG